MKGLVMERDKLLQRGEINMDMMNEFMTEKDDVFEEVIEEREEEKPSMDLFKAIFADSSDSESEGADNGDIGMDVDLQPMVNIVPIAAPKPVLVQPALVIVPPAGESKPPPKSILKKTALMPPTPKVQVDTQVFFKAKTALKMKKAEQTIIPAEEIEEDGMGSFTPVFSKRSAAVAPESTTKRIGSAFGLNVRKKKQKAVAVVTYSDEEDQD
jgi:hypothetical protein